MSPLKRLAVFLTVVAIPVGLMFGAAAEAKTKRQRWHLSNNQRGCPVHQIADGSLVDCNGWRKWSGSIGWDNTCFRTLDYLPSQFACSGRGRF